jgi:hypothetical protein
VLDEQVRDAHLDALEIGHGVKDFGGYEVKPARSCAKLDLQLDPHAEHSGGKSEADIWWP